MPEFYTAFEVAAMLNERFILSSLPGGWVQVERAGIVVGAPTRKEATAEWGHQFSEMIARAKLPISST